MPQLPTPAASAARRGDLSLTDEDRVRIKHVKQLNISFTVNCGMKFATGKDLLGCCSHSSTRTKDSNPIKKLIFPDGQKSFLPSNVYSDGNLYTRTLCLTKGQGAI